MGHMSAIFTQAGRNIKSTWGTQVMTLLTVSLSVLIFAFFFLIYINMIKAGSRFDDDLRIILYLEGEIVPEMQAQMERKIREFSDVEKVVYVSKDDAFERLTNQLGKEKDVLNDLGSAFLPPSIEVYPKKSLKHLTQIKSFADYLATLPGASKVQYGHNWIERMGYFTNLLRIIVLLSGSLLILTTTFIVSYTIRLTVVARQDELEVLRLLGAINSYIQGPLFIEGILQGLLGSATGLIFLFVLFQWIKAKFSGPGFLNLLEFSFFSPLTTLTILFIGTALCAGGSLLSIRKFLRI
ncbi:MAG: ABC transporter permease [Proteobacteria bacterium]|nr:ABC transporter permease [Pseudomonadota bacterium]MBU1710547.1 ABC transporter permease [Pseudomonadota bacterium]